MKKSAVIFLIIMISFFLGYAFKAITSKRISEEVPMRKVTGIGGIFFKCKDPKKVREWYQQHLGMSINDYGAVFEWRQGTDTSKKGFTQWSTFKETSKYFEPSTKDFMINYRVDNLEALVVQLKIEGVTITNKIERVPYGKFVHIMDVEGNKVELWEPYDSEYDKMGKSMGVRTNK